MSYLAVVDYGAGNLMSVTNALSYLGIENRITADPFVIDRAAGIILPGVGAFPSAMQKLKSGGFDETLKKNAALKPLLGICLGMQMLFGFGLEIERTEGLSLIPGSVEKIVTSHKLPHIGWNSLDLKRKSELTAGVSGGSYVYFVHSFCGKPEKEENLIASADYGVPVAAIVQSGNAFGCQFHPEKSGEPGLLMLKNFYNISR